MCHNTIYGTKRPSVSVIYEPLLTKLTKLLIFSDISYSKGGYGRWTVRSNAQAGGSYVHASASERTAGAIDSIVWKNKEFINNFDHGRQLQVCDYTHNYPIIVTKEGP